MMKEKLLEKNQFIIFVLFFACFSFTTWILKIPDLYNLLIYVFIALLLIFLKLKTFTLFAFLIFSIMGNYGLVYYGTEIFASERLSVLVYIVVCIPIFLTLLYRNIFLKIENNEKIKGKLTIPAVLLLIYAIISFFWVPNFMYAFAKFFILFQGYLAYIIFANSDEKINLKQLAWFFSIILLVLSLQYLTIIISYGDKKFDITQKEALFQLWINPNLAAALFGMLWLPSLYKYFADNKSKLTYLFLPFELLVAFAIISTKSRGLYFGLFIMILFMGILLFFKKREICFKLVVGLILSFFFAIIILVLFKDKFGDIFNKIDLFSTNRLLGYEAAINKLKSISKIIFGNGLSSLEYLIDNIYLYDAIFVHSFIFESLVSFGIFGFSMTFYFLWLIFRIIRNNKTNFSFFASLGVIAFLFHNLIDVGYDNSFLGVLFYLMIAVIEINNDEDIKKIKMDSTTMLVDN